MAEFEKKNADTGLQQRMRDILLCTALQQTDVQPTPAHSRSTTNFVSLWQQPYSYLQITLGASRRRRRDNTRGETMILTPPPRKRTSTWCRVGTGRHCQTDSCACPSHISTPQRDHCCANLHPSTPVRHSQPCIFEHPLYDTHTLRPPLAALCT